MWSFTPQQLISNPAGQLNLTCVTSLITDDDWLQTQYFPFSTWIHVKSNAE